MKHLHILGIGGTFMSALAILAKQAGYKVTGCDANCYPPVSDLLAKQGIEWSEGYEVKPQHLKADCFIIGNAIKRGMPVLEEILNLSKEFISAPQWLAENILTNYRVIAVSGTHGKTTTTSMIAHILNEAELNPAFLIGGVATNFQTNAHLGSGKWFVIEADEYDSAFFDKRPKLMHYRPHIALLNNLEFDHADIYPNLEAIKLQFHYYLRTIPSNGIVLKPNQDEALQSVCERGVYSRLEEFDIGGKSTWCAELLDEQGSAFRIFHQQKAIVEVDWNLIGRFNVANAMGAIAACYHAGVSIEKSAQALQSFRAVKRRLEVKYQEDDITIYDDFAHHPSAIAKTIEALKQTKRHKRLLIVLEFGSYTMRTGVHVEAMPKALEKADAVFALAPQDNFLEQISFWSCPFQIFSDTLLIVESITQQVRKGDAILVMSNRGFDNIHEQLIQKLKYLQKHSILIA